MTRFTLPGPQLATAVAWASKLIPARPLAPPLAGVVLDTTDDRLTLSCFDFDTAGTATLTADVAEPGRVLVSGRLLAAVTKTLGARDEATLAVEGEVLRVSIGKGQGWELPTLDIRDYPQLPATPQVVGEVDADALAEALGRVVPAVAADATMAALAGVYLSSGPGEALTIAGTDRYRLAVAELDWNCTAADGELPELLVPGELARHVAAAARESGGTVRLLCDGHNLVGLAGSARTIVGRLVDDSLPWRRIALTPEVTDTTVIRVDTDELRQAVARASVVLGEGESLTLRCDGGGIHVVPTVGGRGRAEHVAEVLTHEGAEQIVGVNARYLRDAVECTGTAQLELRFSARAWQPFLIRPVVAGEIVEGYRHIVAQQKQAVAGVAA